MTSQVEFVREPSDSLVIRRQAASLTCAAANARRLRFVCNGGKRKSASAPPLLGQPQQQAIDDDDDDGDDEDYDESSSSMTSSPSASSSSASLLELSISITRNDVHNFFAEVPYQCWCEASGGDDDEEVVKSRSASVRIAYLKSHFEHDPTGGSAIVGYEFKLQCSPPEGVPEPQVYWIKNGVRLGEGAENLYTTVSGDLIMQTRDENDAGNYTCIAVNTVGKRSSHTAVVQVGRNGGWSTWGSYSTCMSVTGGDTSSMTSSGSEKCVGEQLRYRRCTDPSPSNGGAPCEGDSVQRVVCRNKCPSQQAPAAPNGGNEAGGTWSDWSQCDVGTCQQTRTCVTSSSTSSSASGALKCQPKSKQTRTCSSSSGKICSDPGIERIGWSGSSSGGGAVGSGGATVEKGGNHMLVYSIVSVTVIFLIVAALLCLYKRKRAKLSSFFHGRSSSMATRRSQHRRRHGNAGSDGAVMHVMYTSDEILKSDKFDLVSGVDRLLTTTNNSATSRPLPPPLSRHPAAAPPRHARRNDRFVGVTYLKHKDDDLIDHMSSPQQNHANFFNFTNGGVGVDSGNGGNMIDMTLSPNATHI